MISGISSTATHRRYHSSPAPTGAGLAWGTGAAYVLNYRLIGDEGPTGASTTTYLLPVVAVALGALVLNESITVTMIGGMVLVLGGVALVQRRTLTIRENVPRAARYEAR